MKTLALLSITAFLVGCSKTPDYGDDNLTTETDGSTLTIKRKGVPIARLVNHEDGFFAQVSGGDEKPDMNLYYYEDESSSLAAVPKIVSRTIMKDGEEWLITYDEQGGIASEGRLIAPHTAHSFKSNKQKAEMVMPSKPSD